MTENKLVKIAFNTAMLYDLWRFPNISIPLAVQYHITDIFRPPRFDIKLGKYPR